MTYTDTHTHATAITGLVEVETTTYLRTTCDINVVTDTGIELPQNLLIDAGDLVDDFEDYTTWTAASSPAGGSLADDSTNVKTGSTSLLMTTPAASGYIQATKTVNVTCDGNIRLFIYCADATAPSGGTIILGNETPSFTNYFTLSMNTGGFRIRQAPGWNLINIKTDDWSVGAGSPSWSNAIRQVRIRLSTSADAHSYSVDSLYFNVVGQPAILFTFDDGMDSDYAEAYNYMNTHATRGTAYVVSDNVGGAGKTTWAQLQEMYSSGWTIGNHTKDHTDLTTLTEAQQEAEIGDCNTALVANGITTRQQHVAYPSGAHDANTFTAMTAQSMYTGRTVHGVSANSLIEVLPLTYPYHLYLVGEPIPTTTLATAQGYIDAVVERGEAGIICLHGLSDTPTGSEWYIDRFQGLVDYCIAQNVPVITMHDLYLLQSGNIIIPKAIA